MLWYEFYISFNAFFELPSSNVHLVRSHVHSVLFETYGKRPLVYYTLRTRYSLTGLSYSTTVPGLSEYFVPWLVRTIKVLLHMKFVLADSFQAELLRNVCTMNSISVCVFSYSHHKMFNTKVPLILIFEAKLPSILATCDNQTLLEARCSRCNKKNTIIKIHS